MIDSLPEAILAGMSVGLLGVSANRRLHYANSCAAGLVGVDLAARLGEQIESVISAIAAETLDRQATFEAWEQALLRLDQSPYLELTFGGAARRVIVAQLFPVDLDGALGGSFGIQLRDVTAEREAVRASDELIAVIAHELASPATSLVSFAEVMATCDLPQAERRETHAMMLSESRRLITLIQDLRGNRRLEGSPFHVRPHVVEPRSLFEHAIAVAKAANTNHELTLDLPDALPLVNADAVRVQQVLGNLLSNAQKYSPDGGLVRLSARHVGETIEVSVSDQGLGIPSSARARIFEKFFRIDGDQRRMISGSGLGLAICKDIVEAHGGRIGFDSADTDKGSRFWFTLPVSAAMAPLIRQQVTAPRSRRASAASSGLRVLVVDDDLAIGKLVTLILRADVERVVAVTSGEEALARLRVDRFDVVLSDLGMGLGMDGLELCTLVRRSWPRVRFVLATGSVTIDADEAQALGVDALLMKPYHPAEVRRAIATPRSHFLRTQAA